MFVTKKKMLLFVSLLFVLAALIWGIVVVCNKKMVNDALLEKRYDRVQVRLTETFTETGGAAGENASESKDTQICYLQKEDDLIFQDALSGKCYFYNREGKPYVLFFQRTVGGEADDGNWIEAEADSYPIKKEFDFSVLEEIRKTGLKKSGDAYIPKKNTEELFYKVLQIVNTEKYSDMNMKFYFEQNKLSKIVAHYRYNDLYTVEQIYEITYLDQKIELPKIYKKAN